MLCTNALFVQNNTMYKSLLFCMILDDEEIASMYSAKPFKRTISLVAIGICTWWPLPEGVHLSSTYLSRSSDLCTFALKSGGGRKRNRYRRDRSTVRLIKTRKRRRHMELGLALWRRYCILSLHWPSV